jgi:hypothetical protein
MNNNHICELIPRIKVAHLTNADGILTELRSVYRGARRGEIAMADATKLTYILKVMSEIMTLREMEARLDCLEAGIPYQLRSHNADDQADQEAH